MAYDNIKLNYDYDFKGEIISPTAKANLGEADNGLKPYHMLFGALGSCFYATFLSVAKKMRLTFGSASIEVSGYKSDPELKILDNVEMNLIITNPSNEERLIKSAKLGAEYCSIHALVSKSANIKLNVVFK
ncbi:OsmC family protein [Hujiaoplasma nucleasis]|uniref:OsmC family protein n=1 Tax=Hujiaoplasma nucleasis TaxID=2725268 RepID=A0A7L6N4B7_9MOLU|nr:OsmC family protein [Hujiaoplasma nucleasis]QLY39334.1 OsmC family protein [Hujiaoplasma nucleasis]